MVKLEPQICRDKENGNRLCAQTVKEIFNIKREMVYAAQKKEQIKRRIYILEEWSSKKLNNTKWKEIKKMINLSQQIQKQRTEILEDITTAQDYQLTLRGWKGSNSLRYEDVLKILSDPEIKDQILNKLNLKSFNKVSIAAIAAALSADGPEEIRNRAFKIKKENNKENKENKKTPNNLIGESGLSQQFLSIFSGDKPLDLTRSSAFGRDSIFSPLTDFFKGIGTKGVNKASSVKNAGIKVSTKATSIVKDKVGDPLVKASIATVTPLVQYATTPVIDDYTDSDTDFIKKIKDYMRDSVNKKRTLDQLARSRTLMKGIEKRIASTGEQNNYKKGNAKEKKLMRRKTIEKFIKDNSFSNFQKYKDGNKELWGLPLHQLELADQVREGIFNNNASSLERVFVESIINKIKGDTEKIKYINKKYNQEKERLDAYLQEQKLSCSALISSIEEQREMFGNLQTRNVEQLAGIVMDNLPLWKRVLGPNTIAKIIKYTNSLSEYLNLLNRILEQDPNENDVAKMASYFSTREEFDAIKYIDTENNFTNFQIDALKDYLQDWDIYSNSLKRIYVSLFSPNREVVKLALFEITSKLERERPPVIFGIKKALSQKTIKLEEYSKLVEEARGSITNLQNQKAGASKEKQKKISSGISKLRIYIKDIQEKSQGLNELPDSENIETTIASAITSERRKNSEELRQREKEMKLEQQINTNINKRNTNKIQLDLNKVNIQLDEVSSELNKERAKNVIDINLRKKTAAAAAASAAESNIATAINEAAMNQLRTGIKEGYNISSVGNASDEIEIKSSTNDKNSFTPIYTSPVQLMNYINSNNEWREKPISDLINQKGDDASLNDDIKLGSIFNNEDVIKDLSVELDGDNFNVNIKDDKTTIINTPAPVTKILNTAISPGSNMMIKRKRDDGGFEIADNNLLTPVAKRAKFSKALFFDTPSSSPTNNKFGKIKRRRSIRKRVDYRSYKKGVRSKMSKKVKNTTNNKSNGRRRRSYKVKKKVRVHGRRRRRSKKRTI